MCNFSCSHYWLYRWNNICWETRLWMSLCSHKNQIKCPWERNLPSQFHFNVQKPPPPLLFVLIIWKKVTSTKCKQNQIKYSTHESKKEALVKDVQSECFWFFSTGQVFFFMRKYHFYFLFLFIFYNPDEYLPCRHFFSPSPSAFWHFVTMYFHCL